MSILRTLWNFSTIGIIINTIYYFCKLNFQKAKIGSQLYSDLQRQIMCSYLNVRELKKDWLGRLYCIVNPNLNAQGVFDTNMIIYELDALGLLFSNTQYVEAWLVKKLRIIQDLFKQRTLFSQLSFDVRHVGPKNQDNFLVTISPSFADNVRYWLPKSLKRILIWTIITIIFLITKIYIF